MKTLLILAVFVLIAFVGRVFLSGRRWGAYTGGIEFLLLGALIGSGVVLEMPSGWTNSLFPFIHFQLGLVGLIYGLQLEGHKLVRYSLASWKMLLLETCLPLIAIAITAYYLFNKLLTTEGIDIMPMVIVIAASLAISSPLQIGLLKSRFLKRSNSVRLLQFITGLDGGVGLLVFSFLLFFPFTSFSTWTDVPLRLGGSTIAGVLIAFFVIGALYRRTSFNDMLAVLIGLVLLSGGVAYALESSVLFISVLVGVLIANVRNPRLPLYVLINKVKHPIYLIFLLMAGALWHPLNKEAFFIALILMGVRLVFKWIAVLISGMGAGKYRFGGRLVLGLGSPGAMAIAIVVNFYLFGVRFPLTQMALDVVVWAFLLFVPLGAIMARWSLPKEDYR